MKKVHEIDRLYRIIASRKKADPARSYTARLIGAGVGQCAKKLGEEGVEAALAAVSGSRKDLRRESADVLYHLLVVWAARGVKPKEVYAELAKRQGKSEIEEKSARRI